MIEKMFKQKRYEEIIEYAPKSDKLSGSDIFRIGQSYIKLKRDQEALEMFKKALNKGYKNGEIYFAKGIVESNLEQYYAAQTSFRQALYYMPLRKKVLIELAACYYKSNQLDSALTTYQTIEAHWGEYWPALVMSCQILQEQGYKKKALDCYYTKLPHLKKEKYYYRISLESVMKLEWHTFKNYGKTELAIKNLMETFPENYEYHMLLMQLYNYTNDYEKAHIQEEYILQGYNDLKLSEDYYSKGAMLVDQFDTAQYQIEVYRNFQPEKNENTFYKAFIFNYDGSRPLGKVEGSTNDTTSFLQGYNFDLPIESDKPLLYQQFKTDLLIGLFLPEIPDNDSITEE